MKNTVSQIRKKERKKERKKKRKKKKERKKEYWSRSPSA